MTGGEAKPEADGRNVGVKSPEWVKRAVGWKSGATATVAGTDKWFHSVRRTFNPKTTLADARVALNYTKEAIRDGAKLVTNPKMLSSTFNTALAGLKSAPISTVAKWLPGIGSVVCAGLAVNDTYKAYNIVFNRQTSLGQKAGAVGATLLSWASVPPGVGWFATLARQGLASKLMPETV
jgi:hypothetical protein